MAGVDWSYIMFNMFNRCEDGPIIPAMAEPEELIRPDVAIVHWRKQRHENARRSPAGVPAPIHLRVSSR